MQVMVKDNGIISIQCGKHNLAIDIYVLNCINAVLL